MKQLLQGNIPIEDLLIEETLFNIKTEINEEKQLVLVFNI